jgi:hypothetical protein
MGGRCRTQASFRVVARCARRPPICHAAEAVSGSGAYECRLASVRKIEAKDPRYVTAPDRDSYHTVWFELHQHRINRFGITRDRKPQRAAHSDGRRNRQHARFGSKGSNLTAQDAAEIRKHTSQ